VFTFISERIAAPATSPQLRVAVEKVWDALTEEIGNVFSKFPANRASHTLYREFIAQHVRSRDTIVSFNYDTIFENSVPASHNIYFGGLEERKGSAIRLLKPHGSVDWELVNGKIKITKRPKRSVVVAPTHLKFVVSNGSELSKTSGRYGYLDQTAEMSEIWNIMEKQMRDARALVFIGYSFPPADLYFSSVLRSVLALPASWRRIAIVNPDAYAIGARMKKRFALDAVEPYFDFQQFNRQSRLK
jgi:hypothetical protein